ncbi:MAG: Gfo/Idh/MocA family oxidoreductase [Vicinamibacteria bacterium]|nr:Gfo/Idh/MocA family oxidoreductase [Vicinamibacteria bacterium]
MRLKGVLLGAGNIALRGHAPQWANTLRNQVEIVAIADLSKENRAAAQRIFPEARLFESAEEALDSETPDFVDICTPPFTHRDLIAKAASRGLHIVCEKPLAPSLDEALRIADSVRRARIVFQPCHQYNYAPPWRVVRDLAPRLGAIHFAEYTVRRTAANEGNAHWAPEWRTRRELSGGGILVDHGAHILYQLRSVMGEPKAVNATIRTLLHRNYGVEDTALLTLDHGGALAELSLSWAAKRREIAFRFVGERGELVGDEEKIRLFAETTEEVPLGGMSTNSSHSEWFAPMFSEFVGRVSKRDFDQAPLDEAVYVARVIEKAYASSRAGRALPIEHEPSTALAGGVH